jgi:hypothetical protein
VGKDMWKGYAYPFDIWLVSESFLKVFPCETMLLTGQDAYTFMEMLHVTRVSTEPCVSDVHGPPFPQKSRAQTTLKPLAAPDDLHIGLCDKVLL